jgi:hypothetical protein
MLVSKYLALQLTTAMKPAPDYKIIRWKFASKADEFIQGLTAMFKCPVLSSRQ